MRADEQLAVLTAGVVRVVAEDGLRALLESGRPLRVKLGVDPTAPDIHLGHAVVLDKLRQFQDLGHRAVLIVGDFTAMIGDPSGRSVTRPALSRAEVEIHARTYTEQVFKIIHREDTEVRWNSEWLSRLSLEDMVRLASRVTLARMMEREDIRARHKAGDPIALHELLYPLLQGYDSVAVRADVELGGTDQTFNLSVGRDLQRDFGQTAQVTMVMPLLEGTDGIRKMSKSLNNHIGIAEEPGQMYGKIMSLSDELMARYDTLLSQGDASRRDALKRNTLHPMEAKKQLATEIVTRFHGVESAVQAAHVFEMRHQQRIPHAPPVVRVPVRDDDVWICKLIRDVGFAPSTTEARRLVAQGAVRVDGKRVDLEFRFRRGVHRLLEVGRRRLAEVRFED